MTRVRLSLAALAVLFGCGGGTGPVSPPPPPPPPPPPAPVASVAVSPVSASLVPLETTQLTATPRDAGGNPLSGRTVTWASGAAAVATVSSSGLVSAVSAGAATISATSEGQTGTAAVTVSEGGFITAAGGTVNAFGGDLVVVVPAGGVSTGVALAAARDTNPPASTALIAGTGYSLLPATTAFTPPATVRVRYPAASSVSAAAAATPANFVLHRWNGSAWTPLDNGLVDQETRVVSGTTGAAGTFAILEVTPNPAPAISAVAPLSIVAGSPARQLAVAGTGFIAGSVVRWNGQDRTTTFVSPTSLTVAIPAADLADPGTAQLTVFNPAPGGGNSNAVTITVAASQAAGVEVAVGSFHICATRDDGQAVCWGNNGSGELGRVGGNSGTPVPVSGGHHLTHLAVGSSHSCALDPAGAAWCWGFNSSGQLGDGSTTNRFGPVAVAGGHVFAGLSAGNTTTCGVDMDGAAWCWGGGTSGQLGNGATANSPIPVAVSGAHVFSRLAVGGSAACGLLGDGAAMCWGSRPFLGIGQVGGGGTTPTPTAVLGGHHFDEIRAGLQSFCAREMGGAVFCWGSNANGELGIGTLVTGVGEPAAVAGGLTFSSLAAGSFSACGLASGGDLYCWGSNSAGQAGDGSIVTRRAPTKATTGIRFTRLGHGGKNVCGVTAANEVYCWGSRDFSGLLADGVTNTQWVPVRVAGGHTFAQITAGDQESCGITTGGTTYCWGRSQALGTEEPRDRPVPATLGGQPLASVALGRSAGCGVSAAGAGFCFGLNQSAIFGNGAIGGGSETPTPVNGGLIWDRIAVGGMACGLTIPGALYCWGNGSSAPGPSTSPRAVPGGGVYTSVATAGSHACMLTAAGEAFCRGGHSFGQLGNGVAPCAGSACWADTPVAVAGGHLFTQLAANNFRTCGVATDGAAWCWGSVPLEASSAATPIPVQGSVKFKAVTAGSSAACGIGRDDDLTYCWGFGGLIGVNDGFSRTEPTPVVGPVFVQVSSGQDHSCGLTAAGEAWCWGRRTGGQIGDGSLDYSPTPVQVTW